MNASTRGKLIVFEGLDKAGKTTQCTRLVQTLLQKNHKVRHLRFPDRSTPIGRMIDSYLKDESQQEDHVIHLLFSANRWEAVAQIEADLNDGTIVIIDRYYYSGCVYSAAKSNPSLSLEWARKCDEGLPRPDLCIFLDISVEDATKRGSFGEEKYEKKEMQDRVRQLFGVIRKSAEKDDFVIIDGGKAVDQIEMAVLDAVERRISEVDAGHKPIRRVEPW